MLNMWSLYDRIMTPNLAVRIVANAAARIRRTFPAATQNWRAREGG